MFPMTIAGLLCATTRLMARWGNLSPMPCEKWLASILNWMGYSMSETTNERQSGQRTLDDDRLAALIEVVSRYRLGLKNAEPDILGRAYEYLLRKFAEGQ